MVAGFGIDSWRASKRRAKLHFVKQEPRRVSPCKQWKMELVRLCALSFALLAAILTPRLAAAQNPPPDPSLVLSRVQRLINLGNLAGARAELEQGINAFPRNAAMFNYLGVVDAEQGSGEDAEANFLKAINLAPRYRGAYLNLGHLYQSEIGKRPAAAGQALQTYLKLLQFAPANTEANYQAAVLEMRGGKYAQSLQFLRQLPPAKRELPQSQAVLCVDYASMGRADLASAAAHQLATSPSLSEEDVVSVLPDLKSKPLLAIELLKALKGRNLASTGSLERLGDLQARAGQLADARQTLEAVARRSPTDAAPLISLAEVANRQKDYRGALGYLAHARDLEPKNPAVHFFFGIVCVEMELHQEAYDSLKKAVSLDPGNPYYNYAFGAVASQRDDPREAIPYFEKYCALRPSDPRGTLSLGAVYYYSHQLAASRAELVKVAHQKATAAGANYFLGRIASDEGEWSQALQYLNTAIHSDPSYAGAYAALGGVYLNQKKFSQAQAALLRAIAIEPSNYLANLDLTILYQRTRDPRAQKQAARFAALRTEREQRAKLFLRTIRVVP